MDFFFEFKDQVDAAMFIAPTRSLEYINWPEFSYKPDVKFKIFKVNKGIYIKFWVEEANCKGIVTAPNGPVYKDSCVEFFVRPANDEFYYNFEFNCVGNILLACGVMRYNREFASVSVLEKIIRHASLGIKPIEIKGTTKWELDVYIPFTAFFKHKIESLSNIYCNIYKCGDETLQRHYVSWLPIKTERPDFHRPEYFGIIEL